MRSSGWYPSSVVSKSHGVAPVEGGTTRPRRPAGKGNDVPPRATSRARPRLRWATGWSASRKAALRNAAMAPAWSPLPRGGLPFLRPSASMLVWATAASHGGGAGERGDAGGGGGVGAEAGDWRGESGCTLGECLAISRAGRDGAGAGQRAGRRTPPEPDQLEAVAHLQGAATRCLTEEQVAIRWRVGWPHDRGSGLTSSRTGKIDEHVPTEDDLALIGLERRSGSAARLWRTM